MLKLKKIAVTGTLGAGKTSVCHLMSEAGAFVIDADAIVHHLLASDIDCIEKITALLGSKVRSNNRIDRKMVAKIVFSDPEKLYELESLLHPKVFETIEKAYLKVKKNECYTLFVVECPLLFEVGWESFFDTIIMVTAPRSICLARFKEKGFDPEEYDLRQNRQLEIEKKTKLCQFVINNDKTIKELKEQVTNILKHLH